jgi:hypothetical protein
MIATMALLVACENVRDRELPTLADAEKVAEIAKKLSNEERELLTGYMMRRAVASQPGGAGAGSFPATITVGDALQAQRAFLRGGAQAQGAPSQEDLVACDEATRAAEAETRRPRGSFTIDENVRSAVSVRERVVKAIPACKRAGEHQVAGVLGSYVTQLDGFIGPAQKAIADSRTFKLELRTLLSDYKNNEVRADSLYKTQRVEVSGRVIDTKRDILNDIYVTIGTGGRYEHPVVQCFLSESQANAAGQLEQGQAVTVRGRVDGLLMNVILHACELVAW